ncbi:MAG: TlyA family RNA methyltransferase [Endomicrobium sp.]|jgi:23S rRNA (cytidine1920-2'-O)/16S rRNA (cytidine1409-2'-O)-methyltransferase|nr:TlyA family RNA methyltransferase [Endomicrobium sp.]
MLISQKDKKRLDVLLLDKHLASTLKIAQALIMSKMVYVNDQLEYKPWVLYSINDIITIRNHNLYVSRAGFKLAEALNIFKLDLNGCICLDVGASTGGFTDCMLQHGATKVYAIDVAKGKLHYKLQKDKRVINIERVNFRYFNQSLVEDKIDFITIDVSFISLTKILPVVYKYVPTSHLILPMIKPQFELQPYKMTKGIVRNENLRQQAIKKVKEFSLKLGFTIIAETSSSLKGLKGNLEHFILLKR